MFYRLYYEFKWDLAWSQFYIYILCINDQGVVESPEEWKILYLLHCRR